MCGDMSAQLVLVSDDGIEHEARAAGSTTAAYGAFCLHDLGTAIATCGTGPDEIAKTLIQPSRLSHTATAFLVL